MAQVSPIGGVLAFPGMVPQRWITDFSTFWVCSRKAESPRLLGMSCENTNSPARPNALVQRPCAAAAICC